MPDFCLQLAQIVWRGACNRCTLRCTPQPAQNAWPERGAGRLVVDCFFFRKAEWQYLPPIWLTVVPYGPTTY